MTPSAEHQRLPPRLRGEPHQRPGRDEEEQDGGDREPQRQEVDRGHPLDQVVPLFLQSLPLRRDYAEASSVVRLPPSPSPSLRACCARG